MEIEEKIFKEIEGKGIEEVKEELRSKKEIDLGAYDEECLKRNIMCIEVMGERIPLWRGIESLLYVKDQDTDEIVPFKLRYAQKRLYKALLEQALNGKPMRQDVLKARQLGFSTLIAGILLLSAAYRENTKCVILADIKEHAQNIYETYQNFYNHLDDSLPNYEEIKEYEMETGKRSPYSIKPTLKNTREGLLMRFTNGSSIQVIASDDSSGRSLSCTMIHSSETAFQKDLQKVNRALFKTVSINNKQSMIFIETTANGYNDYKTLWDKDSVGDGAFNALFVPWYDNPDYVRELPNGKLPQLETWIYSKWKQHPELTKEQIYWYWLKYTEDRDPDGMLQEYPWDPSDAFISTGRSTFSMPLIKQRLDELYGKPVLRGFFTYKSETSRDGLTTTMSDIELREDLSGDFKFFKSPEPNKHYVVICDPTKGMNYDFTAIQVLEQNTGVQCASFNAKVGLDEASKQLYCVGMYYNKALLSSENNTGQYVLERLVAMGYPNLYLDQNAVYEDINGSLTRRYGHTTTKANRDVMITQFEIAFRENPNIVNDIETLQQMETFQVVKLKSGGYKPMANGSGAHDDLVMAYVPYWQVRLQQKFDYEVNQQQDNHIVNSSPEAYIAMKMRQRAEKQNEAKNKVSNVLGIRW